MSNISTLSLNLLMERVYLEGQINTMYEEILREENTPSTNESKSVIKKVVDDLKINADFIFTFGVGISAFAGPVKEFLSNSNVKVTEYDVTLLLITAFYILLTKSKEDIQILFNELKKRKLDGELKSLIKFINSFISVAKIIGKKVGVTINSLVDILGFTFLSMPILNVIKNLASENGFNLDNFQQMMIGLTSASTAYLIKNMLSKKTKL